MSTVLIKGAVLVNEGKQYTANVLINNDKISKISKEEIDVRADRVIDAKGKYLFPGCIDDQVHFREPGLTHKAEIKTESRAAVAGGITSFMEMPNTVPNTLTQDLLEEKYQRAAEVSLANYSFYMGVSNDNIDEVLKTDAKRVCGLKIFMGSSTGNMLVDDEHTLSRAFSESNLLIATHCEDERTIQANLLKFKEEFGENIPISAHPIIRNEEACYRSSSLAVELAQKYNTRLHILHISTAKELSLFSGAPLSEKRITSEACVHHLWFTDEDYDSKGTFIKWNPAIKTSRDREAIRDAVNKGVIDVIATDHAPHTLEEKRNGYLKAPSGGPLVQHMLPALLELYHQEVFSLEKIVEKTSHAVADCFGIEGRGYIREGYFADLVLVDLNQPWTVSEDNILYKCKWSPFDGVTFRSSVTHTFVNGNMVYEEGNIIDETRGERLTFDR